MSTTATAIQPQTTAGLGRAATEVEALTAEHKLAVRTFARVPSLDGFRAICIGMVLLHHAMRTADFPPRLAHVLKYLINGNLGVRMFFVISGFIITMLLLKEEAAKGKVSLKLFYERRAARILPVYCTYILWVFIYGVIGGVAVSPRAFVEALTFTTSWFHTHQWIFEHSWSLSLEEAFYLLWPVLFVTLTQARRMCLALVVIIAGPLLRVWLYHRTGESYFAFYSLSVAGNPDPIMWGCLLALLHQSCPGRLQQLARNFPLLCHGSFFVCMLALIRLNADEKYHQYVTVPLTVSISCLWTCYLLYYHCYISRGVGFRVLNHPLMVRVGVLSYSLYLWQQSFLFPAPLHRFWWQTFPANLTWAVLVGTASYYLLEKPFLRLRDKLRRRSLGTDEFEQVEARPTAPMQNIPAPMPSDSSVVVPLSSRPV